MDYRETTEYLFRQLPMFEREGRKGYKSGLYNTLALDAHSGHPHRNYRTIHIAGTNGKGSCAHTIAAALQLAGHRVGLYTSPHLVDFRERIRINGEPISEEYVVDYVRKERKFFEPLHPSFFELTTAMAFKWFADQHVDYAVIEVGLGGRLDCTNIITPELSIITNIGLDHTQLLGSTLSLIASEKAGIIKEGVPVVVGETCPETRTVFGKKAEEMGAPIIFAEDDHKILSASSLDDGSMRFSTKDYGIVRGALGGVCQAKNANTILTALDHLGLPAGCIREAFSQVVSLTGLMGRWQIVGRKPMVVCDTGHNVEAWQYLSRQLSSQECRQKRIVFGMVDDKDLDGVLRLLPPDARYYFTQAQSKRAVPCDEIKRRGETFGLKGEAYPSVATAFDEAINEASEEDFIFVGGSSYVVADFLQRHS